ncbi:MAG: helix-turn-helix domain-containing protein [Gemmatimonadota bacterium]
MNLSQRIQQLVAALPSNSSAVTLTRADLIAWTQDLVADPLGEDDRHLTVAEVAKKTGRATSTVRSWLIAGELTGYKLNNRDWRIPPSALRDYLEGQAHKPEPTTVAPEPVDIAAWRR